MPLQVPSAEVKGKVIASGVREGETVAGYKWAHAWVQVLDTQLREIVEVTANVADGRPSPFEGTARGAFLTLPVGQPRMFHAMVTYTLVEAEPAERVDGNGAITDDDADVL